MHAKALIPHVLKQRSLQWVGDHCLDSPYSHAANFESKWFSFNPKIEWTPLLRSESPMLRTFVTTLALTTIVLIGCTSNLTTTTQAGKDAASRDIMAGKLVLRSQNLPYPPGENEYTKLLKDRCGFTFKVIAGKLTDADDAYNEAMQMEAKRKFGNDIFILLRAEAKANYEQGL